MDTNFIEDDTDAPMYVELRGITWVHKDAFDRVRGPLTLHLDPDPGGNPHRLHFSEAVETPTGTGFLPLWSKDAPYPETPECNHGLVDIAERIFQDGWDTGRWILEASEFIGNNPEDCHTNSYVPVARVSGHEASCRGEWNTFLRTGSSNDDLYLQWERAWIHPDQPLCWTRSEHSDGTVEWEGWVRGRSRGDIPAGGQPVPEAMVTPSQPFWTPVFGRRPHGGWPIPSGGRGPCGVAGGTSGRSRGRKTAAAAEPRYPSGPVAEPEGQRKARRTPPLRLQRVPVRCGGEQGRIPDPNPISNPIPTRKRSEFQCREQAFPLEST